MQKLETPGLEPGGDVSSPVLGDEGAPRAPMGDYARPQLKSRQGSHGTGVTRCYMGAFLSTSSTAGDGEQTPVDYTTTSVYLRWNRISGGSSYLGTLPWFVMASV